MSRFHSYINTVSFIIREYDGTVPLAGWLRNFFSKQKKFGSRDRKIIAQIIYSFYRAGHAARDLPTQERILNALWLCSTKEIPVLEALHPALNQQTNLSLIEKLKIAGQSYELSKVFPWESEISEKIDFNAYAGSFFVQPDLFLRIRPGKNEKVIKQLHDAGINFDELPGQSLRLPNHTPVESIVDTGAEAIVQDLQSQRTVTMLANESVQRGMTVWDCCAGSGGKSLLLADTFPGIRITASDKRKSILVNLERRFQAAGISPQRIFEADLSTQAKILSDNYDLILCDAPCTGSGTWSRTPEQMYFFNESSISQYVSTQRQIIERIIPQIKPGGLLLYITCSVFEKENEGNVQFIQQKFHPATCRMEYFKGYDDRSDTMFAAVFRFL